MRIVTKTNLFRLACSFTFALMLAVFAGNTAFAQRTVNVSPGVGTLNTAIDSDTTDTGARVDSNTVYVLERDGTYLLEGSIEHRGYHLSIVAEDGDGARPMLIPAVPDGGESGRPFRPRGDLTIKGLYVTGQDELGGLTTRMFRISENDVTIRIDDSHLDKDGQTAFRNDGTGVRLFLTNSTVSNMGITSSPDNGRVLDDRGNQMDTVYFENNTFYNITAQIIRDAGGLINYAYFNQNTAYNVGKGTAVEFGPVVEGVFENNILINAAAYGYPENEEVAYILDVDAMTTEETDSLGAQSVSISNNNIFTASEITDAYPDTVNAAVLFTETAESFIEAQSSASTNISEDITFTSAPGLPTTVVTEFYAGSAGTTEFDTANEPFDFSYADTFTSYSAGTQGQALGSLNWFPGMTVSVEEDLFSDNPEGFKINGNYPNPFNPSTNISISLPQAADVSVDIFNMIGQKVLSIPAQRLAAGTNQNLRVEAGNLTSGMYIYRVTATSGANTMVNSGRMTLIK